MSYFCSHNLITEQVHVNINAIGEQDTRRKMHTTYGIHCKCLHKTSKHLSCIENV